MVRVMMNKKIVSGGVVMCMLLSMGSVASAQSTDREWAVLFGDGMRMWAEGRYDEALTHLYHAYAMQPTARTLKFIIRSHDFIGHCNAAHEQSKLFAEEFPGVEVPELQRCERPATLTLRCEQPTAKILVGEHIQASCDQVIKVPGGEYTIRAPSLDFTERLELSDGQARSFTIKVQPTKWTRARSKHAEVPRIVGGSERFTVFLSRDGIYQIWVKDNAADLLDPYKGSAICHQNDEGKKRCEPMTKAQRDKLRALIPRVD